MYGMRKRFLTASAAVALATSAQAAPSPEKEAIDTFASFCMMTNANPTAITKAMAGVEKAGAGGKIDAAALTKTTGIKADHAWTLTVGESRQQLLLVTYQNICALHLSSGDGEKVKKEFISTAEAFAKTVKGTLNRLDQKKKDKMELALYNVKRNGPSPVLGITTAPEMSASGTKHLLSFTAITKPPAKKPTAPAKKK